MPELMGTGTAHGAISILNAIPAGKGAALSIPLQTRAKLILRSQPGFQIKIESDLPVDDSLVRKCLEVLFSKFEFKSGGYLEIQSQIPVAAGFKSSSAAANATILAGLDALSKSGYEIDMDPLEAIMIGVDCSLHLGISITGAMDDSCASMLGGLVITDNIQRRLLVHREFQHQIAILIPQSRMPTSKIDIEAQRLFKPLADLGFQLALRGDYYTAMNLNGLIQCAALGYDPRLILQPLKLGAKSASISGTGPGVGALIDHSTKLDSLAEFWGRYGKVVFTQANNSSCWNF